LEENNNCGGGLMNDNGLGTFLFLVLLTLICIIRGLAKGELYFDTVEWQIKCTEKCSPDGTDERKIKPSLIITNSETKRKVGL
jgi:hypothetical protein